MSQPLVRSTPEAEGITSAAVLDFITAAEKEVDALHSMMVVRHGKVVAEGWWGPYKAEDPHRLFSLSKSFTSTAVALAIAEGQLTLDDLVLDYFVDEAPADPGENLKAMRIRDLLAMNSGHQNDTLGEFFENPDVPWTRSFLSQEVDHKPGTHFVYNTGATYMVSAILKKATGEDLVDYLKPRLFDPLGIEGYTWEKSPQGISLGGWGLRIKTEDIARFGQLYLQKGVWNGERILSEEWVDAATERQSSNGSNPKSDWEQGYGYQFWRCRHGAYRGDGAFGQYCIVLPDQDAVVAITSGLTDMQAALNLVWKHLLPAMGPEALPANERTHKALSERLTRLNLPALHDKVSLSKAVDVSGKIYAFDENDQGLQSLSLGSTNQGDALTIHDGSGEHLIPIGKGSWAEGVTTYGDSVLQPMAASGGWVDEGTYRIRIYYTETPFSSTLDLSFAGDKVHFDRAMHVSFGPTKMDQLVGHRK